jgi:hypothetical protein
MSRGIVERIPSVVLNGDPERRYIGNLNFSFAYVEGESLLMVRCPGTDMLSMLDANGRAIMYHG